jgi:exosortase/archaeosortase family protein
MSTEAQGAAVPQLDATTRGLGWLMLGMAGFTAWDQWAIWSTKDDYTFGYLVPVFSGYVLWDRWDELRAWLTGNRSLPGPAVRPWLLRLITALTFGALLMFALGAAARAITGTGVVPTLAIAFGFAGTALGCAFLSVQGPQQTEATGRARVAATALMLFPAGVWLISGPFLYLIDNQIKGELLTNVTELVSGILRATDHVIRVSGNTIIFANNDAVGVADACSGIRSFSACVFVGAFLGAIFLEGGLFSSLARRMAMIGLSAFAAILLNIGRNTYLAFHAMNHGSRTLDRDFNGLEPGSVGFSAFGTVHDFAGNAAMLLAFLVLLACVPLLNRLGRGPSPSA